MKVKEYTGRQIGPSLPNEHGYQTHGEQMIPNQYPGTFNRFAIFILGALVIVMSIALLVGGALAWSKINEYDEAAAGYQRDAQALAVERDQAISDFQAAAADVDELKGQLNATILDLEAVEEERTVALSDLSEIKADFTEQERLLSQAREEFSRQQELTIEAEEYAAKLDAIVEIDDEIQWLFIDYIELAWWAFETESEQDYIEIMAELEIVTDELIDLLERREQMIADL
jgi:hypothetical protein